MIEVALICYALNAYHEARGEPDPMTAMQAVVHVTKNRVDAPWYPDDPCAVVFQDLGPKPGDCQFSWTCDGKSDEAHEAEAWRMAMSAALGVLRGGVSDPTGGATHYWSTCIYQAREWSPPGWSLRLASTVEIGCHKFHIENRA